MKKRKTNESIEGVLAEITHKEAKRHNLFAVTSIPGRCFDHAFWRLVTHFENLDKIVAFTMEKGDFLGRGDEGTVHVIFWTKEQIVKI